MTPRLLLATRNPHKLAELERMLEGAVGLDPLPEDADVPDETGETFAANALIKARAAVAATGRSAIADDSGVEAEALGGAPGVRSARYAGPDATDAENLAKFVAEVPAGSRVRYVCAIAFVAPDGAEHVVEGDCSGTMAAAPRGAGGFGYDPVFLPSEHGASRTMAELSAAEKDAVSHRGRAARALQAWLSLDPPIDRG